MGYAESPTPIIFCCSPLDQGFEYFKSLEQQGMNNFAILDIDGSYTNNKVFEELPDELHILRMLNNLKNKRVTKYDYAYKELL
jgi:hypothetical protein